MPMATATMALTTVAMMLAMMLPSIAPAVWRYHRRLRATRAPVAAQRTMLFAAGYLSVWAAAALALFASSVGLSATGALGLTGPLFGPWATAVVVLGAGALQCSPWKVNQLRRCRWARVTNPLAPRQVITAWRDGCMLGVACALSCAAPMAVLLAAGLMNARMMLVITAAITAERVGAASARVARVSGALIVVAGLAVCLPL